MTKPKKQRGAIAATMLAFVAVWSASLSSANAEETSAARSVLEDAKLYFTAPIRWDKKDWLYFGGTLAAIAVAHEYDDNVRDHFVRNSATALDGKDPNRLSDAVPAAAIVAATLSYAALIGDRAGYQEAGAMVEAAGLSVVDAYALKFATGRLAPNETTDVDSWWEHGDSFPSVPPPPF